MKKILLIGDIPIYVDSVCILLESRLKDVQVEIARNYGEIFKKLSTSNYDLIILNIEMGVDSWSKNILKLYPSIPTLLFTDNVPLKLAKTLYKAGVLGILPLAASLDTIIMAVEKVMDNQIYMTNDFKSYIVHSTPEYNNTELQKLTDREAEIAILMIRGERMVAICKHLNLKKTTISTFKIRIFKKLGVTNLLELNHAIKQSIKKV